MEGPHYCPGPIIELQLSRYVDGLESIGRQAIGDIDFDVQFVIFSVCKQVLLFWF